MTDKEIAQLLRRLAGAANKRLRKLEQTGLNYAPAYIRAVMNQAEYVNGVPHYSGADRGRVSNVSRIAGLRRFLQSPTSTPSGLREEEKKGSSGIDWDRIERLRAQRPDLFNGSKGSPSVSWQELTAWFDEGLTDNEILDRLDGTSEEFERDIDELFNFSGSGSGS